MSAHGINVSGLTACGVLATTVLLAAAFETPVLAGVSYQACRFKRVMNKDGALCQPLFRFDEQYGGDVLQQPRRDGETEKQQELKRLGFKLPSPLSQWFAKHAATTGLQKTYIKNNFIKGRSIKSFVLVGILGLLFTLSG